MLVPDKHITLAESMVGLGGVILEKLSQPRSVDYLYKNIRHDIECGELPVHHDFDSVLLAILFLYAIGAVTDTADGKIKQCV